MQAGLVGLQGPGVIVTLDDSPRRRPRDADPYFYVVHDVDLQALVNELWAGGAEAVAINDQRVVYRTAIRSAGPAIVVNGVRLSPPYHVRAIGPADLAEGLAVPEGFLWSMNTLVQHGGQASVARVAQITVPAYAGQLSYRYARPVR